MEKLKLKAKVNVDPEEGYTAIASTIQEDRDGEIILPSAFKNLDSVVARGAPIFLNHAWRGGAGEEGMPIGKIVAAWAEPEALMIKFEFAEGGPLTLAPKVKYLVDKGFLNSMSVGAIPKKWETDKEGRRVYTDLELLEVSVVGIPSNRGASIMNALKTAGLTLTKSEREHLVDGNTLTEGLPEIFQEVVNEAPEEDQAELAKVIREHLADEDAIIRDKMLKASPMGVPVAPAR